jgi:protein-tyrosine phosphatase
MSEGKIVRVLFVCLGNICRSPMAESIFRHQVERAGLSRRIQVDSAGTSGYHIGDPPHHGTQRVLRERGIACSRVARVVTMDDFVRFDYIVALDQSNLGDLRAMRAGMVAHLSLLLDHAPGLGIRDVPDPYYSGRFAEVYEIIEQGCRGLLEHIVAAEGLVTRSRSSI